MVVASAALARGSTRLDPEWPPVLVAVVVAGVSAAALWVVMMFRRLRAEARRSRRRGSSPR